MEELEKVYIDYSFPSFDKLYKLAKQNGIDVSTKQIKTFLENQKTFQLYKKSKKVVGHPITTGKPLTEYQCDLADFAKLAGQNKGYKYILLVVDIFTRFAFGLPVKSKSPDDVVEAFKEAFKEMPIPRTITSDNGKEFMGKVSQYFKDNSIYHRTNDVGDHNVLGIVDRLTQTIKNKLYKVMQHNDNAVWYDKLDNVINSYNQTPHSTLKEMTPFEATLPENEQIVAEIHDERIAKAQSFDNFNVGDIVRLKKQKRTFERSYDTKWSSKTFEITDKRGLLYVLNDGREVRGQFLQKVNEHDTDESLPAVAIEKQKAKVEQVLKREDIDKQNIIEAPEQSIEAPRRSGRERKPNKKYL